MKNKILVVLTIMALASVGVVQAAPPGPTIVDVAIAVNSEGPYEGEFDILIAAVLAADPAVLNTLSGNGQFTVFAPTDDAFVDLLGELDITAEDLLENQQLVTQVLLYHVVRGRIYSEDVLEKNIIRTLQGGFLFQDGGTLTDNNDRGSNIIITDVEAANGIIHVIDAVVLH